MSITIDDDFDFIEDGRRDTDDEGPALRADYVPLEPFENGKTFGAGIGGAGKEPEPFLTVRDPSLGTIDWNRFIRPATPEEIRAYDEWEEQRAKQGMGTVISQVFEDRRQAWEQTPDQAAHRLWLEQQTGISQRMLRDPDVLRTAELRAQMDMDALTLHDAPEQVLSWLKTPGMLEIARDDLETLKKVGDALQRLAASKAPIRPGGIGRKFQRGISNMVEGWADNLQRQAIGTAIPDIPGLGGGYLGNLELHLPAEAAKRAVENLRTSILQSAERRRGWAATLRPEPFIEPKEGTLYRWIGDVAEATPYTLTGMPLSAALTAGGAALGGPLGATAGAALSSLIQTHNEAETEQTQAWKRLVDEGMDPIEANEKTYREVYLPNFGLLYLSNFLQDRLTFGVPLGRGAAYWAKRGGNFLLASLFEGAEEIGQSLIANRALGEANDWGQLLYEGLVGVGVGMVFGGGGAALDTAIGRYREHRSEGRAAEESARIGVVMDEAAKAAEASKVRERSPEAFDDFVEYIGEQGQEKVNVDGAVFFQTFGEDAAAAAERLGVRDQLEEVAQTGGAVEITTAAILQNPDLYEKVKDDLRYSDGGMSRNEAQEYERTRGERFRQIVGDAAAAERTVQEAGEKAERIRDGLRAQFEALGHKKVGRREAEFYSTLWTAALANEARYAGMSIEEMARQPQWNVRFQFDKDGDVRPGGEPLAQPVNPGVNLEQKVPILDLSDKIPDARKATPQELLELLKTEFVGKEPNISADGEAMIGLPSNAMAKHVVRSSWKGLTYEDMDTRTAGLMSLRDVLQNSTLIESHENQKSSKTHLKNIHRFYIPVWASEGLKTLRIVAHESKTSDGKTPVEVDLNDLIVERQNESPARLSGTPLSGVLPERQLRGAFQITIADMLRGVKDAEGRPYVGEEYRQTSPRQSPDYDSSDPKTWPPSAERDEAIQLDAWTSFEPDGFIEDWPESTEKTEALALQKESDEIEAWIDSFPKEEILRRRHNDDPELDRKYSRVDEIDRHIKKLSRVLEKKKPKGAQRRLTQLIDAEEAAAARELGEEYYKNAESPLGYARFEEAETIVAILKDGNRSTFLHELGHVLLNSRLRLALTEGVDETVREDWTRLVEWLEVADVDFSKPLSEADEKRWKDAHEKFAAGFEKYLMEGKAPSADLARAFRAFRKWLLDIYKAVRNIFYVDADGNRVEFEINDEIRSVMDRMLATEEEIEASRAVREAERLAYILSEQGIPDDVAARYRDVIAEGTDAAKAKLMKKLAAELKAEKQAELKEARRAAKKRAGAEVWALPEYRALKALRTPREKGGLRLSVPALTELYGDAGAEALMKELPVGVLANDGLSPEAAAELLGYGTPEELLEGLKRARTLPPQQAIEDRVRAATTQLESLIHDPEALRAEAERILHDRERLEWLALETEMLDEAARRAGKRIGDDARKQEREQEKQRERASDKKAEEELRGAFGPENLAAMAKAAAAEAKRILAGKRMRDISAPHYMAAEKRASAKALQAAASARFDEARQWKWTELINHALAIEAMRVREEYEKGKKQLERYWPNRKRLRGVIGNEAFGQIVGLLERLGVNPEDPRAKDRPRLDEYLNTLAQKRETTPPVARWLRDLDIRDARASLANLNPEQFEDVMTAVGALDRIGRLDNKLLTAQRDETFTETVERLRAETEKRHGLPGPQSRATDQKGVGLFAGALASLDRVETLLRQADGLEEQGAFWETIYLPAQRAHEAELVKGKAAKEAIAALFEKHFKDKKAFNRFLNEKHDAGMIDPGTGKKLYWSGENLLCAMLNWGNQHNRERLVFGNGLTENALKTAVRPADDAQYYAEYEAGKAVAETIFNRLSSDAMWDFCQDVWDYLDTFWPEIQALEERLNGAAPEKVEALPVRTASGKVLRGGYYPVRFDANADWTAFVHNEQETVKALYEDQTHRPGTRKGHTKERVERVAPRQLLLSLDVIAEHTANVVHDLTHREAVRDLYKLIHDDTVRGLLTHAVGRAGFEQFSPWIQSLAAPSVPTDKADRVFSKAMGNAAAVQLGLNVVSSVGQTVSLVPAAWKLGLRRIVPAILNTLTLRGFWDSKYRDFAFALSPELADRINGTDRNIRAALELERSGAGKRALSGAKATLYVALGWADMAVSLPVWHAAYEKGMARWDNQRKAVDYANYIVRTTNNAGAVKDLAQVQRGGPTRRLFTMYYSAFGSLYQMFHEQMTRAGREGIPGKIKLAAFCFMMFTVQSALEDLVKGRAPLGDDEDDDSIEKWLLRGTFSTFSSMFPIMRDIASGTTLLGGTGKFRPSPALEAGAAFVKAIDSGARFVADIWDGEDVEADRVVRDMVMAGGYAFGLPSVQLLRWYKTFVRWTNDEPDWSPWELIWSKRGR